MLFDLIIGIWHFIVFLGKCFLWGGFFLYIYTAIGILEYYKIDKDRNKTDMEVEAEIDSLWNKMLPKKHNSFLVKFIFIGGTLIWTTLFGLFHADGFLVTLWVGVPSVWLLTYNWPERLWMRRPWNNYGSARYNSPWVNDSLAGWVTTSLVTIALISIIFVILQNSVMPLIIRIFC